MQPQVSSPNKIWSIPK